MLEKDNVLISNTRFKQKSIFLSDFLVIGTIYFLATHSSWSWWLLPAVVMYFNFSTKIHLDSVLLKMLLKGNLSLSLIVAQTGKDQTLEQLCFKCVAVIKKAYFFAVAFIILSGVMYASRSSL